MKKIEFFRFSNSYPITQRRMELQIGSSGALYPASLSAQASFSGWEIMTVCGGSPAGGLRLGVGLFEKNSGEVSCHTSG